MANIENGIFSFSVFNGEENKGILYSAVYDLFKESKEWERATDKDDIYVRDALLLFLGSKEGLYAVYSTEDFEALYEYIFYNFYQENL